MIQFCISCVHFYFVNANAEILMQRVQWSLCACRLNGGEQSKACIEDQSRDVAKQTVDGAGLGYLVVELLQQAVQPGLCHLHGPRLVGYVAHFDENHHQLQTGTRCKSLKTTCCFLLLPTCNAKQLSHSAHHVPVLLAGEVKRRQDGLELAEDLVVPRHVCGQDASAGRAEWSAVLTISKMRQHARSVELVKWSHLMIPSLIRLYWSTERFLKMLLSVWKKNKTENPQCFIFSSSSKSYVSWHLWR